MRSLLLRLLDNWRAPAPAPERVGWLGQWRYAHRGLHADGLPENSPAAFAAAIGQGMGIECDVQRSADGRAMVFHDAGLDRLTDEAGPLAARNAAELERINLRGSTDCIPQLSRLLDQVAGAVPLLIEVKSQGDHRVIALCLAVKRALEGYRGEHAVMSFDPRVARWFAQHSPATLRGLVLSERDFPGVLGPWRLHGAIWHARPDFLAWDVRDLPSKRAAAQRARGLPLLTWTVRSAELAAIAAAHADAPIAEGDGVV